MRAIIIDDEPKAIRLLTGYLELFPTIELVASFRNGLKAFEYIGQHELDLVFLDINMPHLSGISLAKMLPSSLKVIFTTAHAEYAVESYDLAATDYLLKPISLERFSKAVQKLQAPSSSSPKQIKKLLLNSGKKLHQIRIDEIQYLEKDGNYMTYFLPQQRIVVRATVASALAELPEYFMQVHKSFIVNIHQIRSLEKDCIHLENKTISIGPLYKGALLERLKAN